MALKVGNTTVVNNTPNTEWSFIGQKPANLVQSVIINGTGTTTTYVNYYSANATLVITRT